MSQTTSPDDRSLKDHVAFPHRDIVQIGNGRTETVTVADRHCLHPRHRTGERHRSVLGGVHRAPRASLKVDSMVTCIGTFRPVGRNPLAGNGRSQTERE